MILWDELCGILGGLDVIAESSTKSLKTGRKQRGLMRWKGRDRWFSPKILYFSQFGSNRQLDRIADICYLNFNRQHPDEDCRWVSNTATDCDSSGYIHNLKFALARFQKGNSYQLSMVN